MPDYWLIAGVGSTVISGLFYTFYKNNNNVVKSLQSATQIDIGPELRHVLEVSEDHSLPYVAIKGDALPNKASDVLTSAHVPDFLSLVKKVNTYELKSEWSESSRVWYDVKRLLNSVVQSVPFKLCSVDDSVLVTEPLSAQDLELQNVYDKFEPVSQNTTQTILQWASGDKTKGFQTVEKALPVGTTLLGIGKLSLTKDGIVLSPPSDGKPYILSQLNMDTLVRNAQSNKGLWKTISIIFACGSGILLCIALYNYYKKWMERMENEQLWRDLREEGENFNAGTVGETCVICLDRPRDTVILECGHICVCRVCSQKISECPVCRGNISRLVSTYRS